MLGYLFYIVSYLATYLHKHRPTHFLGTNVATHLVHFCQSHEVPPPLGLVSLTKLKILLLGLNH